MAISPQHQQLAQDISARTGIDVNVVIKWIMDHGEVFAQMLQLILLLFAKQPMQAKASGQPKGCDPGLQAQLQKAMITACQNCCDICCAMDMANCQAPPPPP